MIWSHREYTETTNYPILFEKSSQKLSKFSSISWDPDGIVRPARLDSGQLRQVAKSRPTSRFGVGKGPLQTPSPRRSTHSKLPFPAAMASGQPLPSSVQPQSKPCYRNGPWSSALDIVLEVVLSFPGKEHTNRMCTWNSSCHTLWPSSWSFGPSISRVAAFYTNAFKSTCYAVYNYSSLSCVVSSWSDIFRHLQSPPRTTFICTESRWLTSPIVSTEMVPSGTSL